jgi:pimeloyl-ACP methyl ester carboxylesterase
MEKKSDNTIILLKYQKMEIKKSWETIEGQRVQCTKFFIKSNEVKAPLVILHGWDPEMDIEKSFGKLAKKLLETNPNLEIIAPNLPGFGVSDFSLSEASPASHPLVSDRGLSTYDYADFVEKFCQKLKIENPIFLTHSFGGRVLVRLLRKNPNFKNKLILIASAGIKWPLSLRQKISVFLSQKFKRAKNLLPQKIQKIIISKIFGARDWGAVPERLKLSLDIVLKELDFRDELSKITNKTLLLWGAKDSVTPLKSGQVFAEKLPNVQLKIFEDGKHGIHLTHSKECAEAIFNFLKK